MTEKEKILAAHLAAMCCQADEDCPAEYRTEHFRSTMDGAYDYLKQIGYLKIKLNNLYFLQLITYLNIMPLSKEDLEKHIRDSFPDSKINIEDLRGDGDHYSATVISKSFEGKSKIEQHKMVYDSLKGKMGNELHALMLKTRTE